MKRNILLLLLEFNELEKEMPEIELYSSDFQRLYENSVDENGKPDVFRLISDTYSCGFVVGYHAAISKMQEVLPTKNYERSVNGIT